MTRRFKAATGSLVTALALSGGPVFADVTKAQCVAANGDGQSLRRDQKLAEARAQFRLCADTKCPSIVAADCTKRLDELEAAQPTIIFDAKDGSGHDISAVTVTIDGRPFASALDGPPLPVEPGEHSFTFTVAGGSPVTLTFVLKEGDKARHEKVIIGPPPPAPAAATETPPGATDGAAPTEPAPTGLGTKRIAGLAVGGAGVVGVAVGGILGVLAASAISQQKSDCSTSTDCPRRAQAASEHSTGSTDSTVSTVAFIAGGALLVTGAVLFFTAKRASQATGLFVAPTVGPNTAGMFLRGEF